METNGKGKGTIGTVITVLVAVVFAIIASISVSAMSAKKEENNITTVCEHRRVIYNEGKEATCTSEGRKENWECAECGKKYADKSMTEEIQEITIQKRNHKYKDITVEPTCTEEGYTIHICNDCGETITDNIQPAKGHRYTESETPATCTEKGYTEYECDECGDKYTEEHQATGHKYKDRVIDPDCVNTGYTEHVCEDCGDRYISDETEEKGHEYEETVVNSTCSEEGYTLHKCKNCNDEYRDNKTEKKAHEWNEGKEAKKPTCKEVGIREYKCKNCEATREEEIPMSEHRYTERIIAPTCTENGYTEHTCEECGDSYKDNVKLAKGHEYEITVINPTCNKEGYTLHKCKNCDAEYRDNRTEKKTHEWNEGREEKEPTCTEDGETVYTCKVCGTERRETVTSKGHEYEITVINPTCNKEGYTLHKCKNCNAEYRDNKTEKTEHEWTEGKEEKEPTCTEDGITVYTCRVCGTERRETITSKGHEYIQSIKAPTCTEEGYTLHKCKNCNAEYITDEKQATGHKIKEVWESDGAEHWKECEKCGEKEGIGRHEYENGVCTVCGYEKSVLVYGEREDGTYEVIGIDGEITEIEIPTEYNGRAVTGIGSKAFEGNMQLKRVTISPGVKRIEADAFKDCKKITEMGLTDDVEYIGDGAFEGCGGIREELYIGKNMRYIGRNALNGVPTTKIKIAESSGWEYATASNPNNWRSISKLNSAGLDLHISDYLRRVAE